MLKVVWRQVSHSLTLAFPLHTDYNGTEITGFSLHYSIYFVF